MDVLGLAEMLGKAGELWRLASREPLPDWASDEVAFTRHFGVPVEYYHFVTSRMSPEQSQLLRDTLAVNPEAAVLWVLAMREVE